VVTYPHTNFQFDSTTTAKDDFSRSESRAVRQRRGLGVVWDIARMFTAKGVTTGVVLINFHQKKFKL
jgi:hypothetical protein